MASSGTLGTPAIYFKYKPRDRESVLVSGVVRVHGGAPVLEASDLELRTIKSIFVTQHAFTATVGGPFGVTGSIKVPGSLSNEVTIKSVMGSLKLTGGGAAYPGTPHYGTVVGKFGTQQLDFLAIGA